MATKAGWLIALISTELPVETASKTRELLVNNTMHNLVMCSLYKEDLVALVELLHGFLLTADSQSVGQDH